MKINLSLQVTGTVNQTIEANPDCKLTAKQITTGLKTGSIITSIGHGNNNGRVYKISDGDLGLIGRVVAQEACDDVEFEIESSTVKEVAE